MDQDLMSPSIKNILGQTGGEKTKQNQQQFDHLSQCQENCFLKGKYFRCKTEVLHLQELKTNNIIFSNCISVICYNWN